MGREPRRPKVVPGFDSLEPRDLLAASPAMVAVISSGVDLNASDPIHVVGDTKYLDFSNAYNAVDGTIGQSAVVDITPSREGSRILSQVLQGIADSVAAGGSSNVQVVPIQINSPSFGSPFYALIGGIEHAADIGAQVIEVSYTARQAELSPGQVQELQKAFTYARSRNAIVVVPAGDGFGATSGGFPVGVNLDEAGANRVMYPGTFHQSNMLVVAATDSSGTLGSISNWGPIHVDLGVPTTLANRVTGLAAGYAAGVAAVVAATRTDWSAIDVVNRIEATVQPSASLAGKVTSGGMISPALALGGTAGAGTPSTPNDFDGDLKADFFVFGNIPAVGGYGFAGLSSTQAFSTAVPTLVNNAGFSLGGKGGIPVPGAFYGGGVTHPAIFGPEYGANGLPDGKYDFAILSPDLIGQYFITTFVPGIGGPGDIPVVGDFLGDGKSDLALYGDHNGQFNFQVLTAASNFDPTKMLTLNYNGFGFGGFGSVPVVGDFFGNGRADPAVYGPEIGPNGLPTGKYDFAALDPSSINASGQYTRNLFVQGIGQPGDLPIVGDYDGDGKSDLALYGTHNGQFNFQVIASSTGFNPSAPLILNNAGFGFGGPGSVPISGDFFGDGGSDIAVFGPEFGSNGQPNGLYDLAAIDTKSRTKSLVVRGFGGSNTIAASAPPVIKWFQAQNG